MPGAHASSTTVPSLVRSSRPHGLCGLAVLERVHCAVRGGELLGKKGENRLRFLRGHGNKVKIRGATDADALKKAGSPDGILHVRGRDTRARHLAAKFGGKFLPSPPPTRWEQTTPVAPSLQTLLLLSFPSHLPVFFFLLLPLPAAARYKYITLPIRLSASTPAQPYAAGNCVRASACPRCTYLSCRAVALASVSRASDVEFADVHLISPEDSGIRIHRGDREKKWGSNFESPGTICSRFRYRH